MLLESCLICLRGCVRHSLVTALWTDLSGLWPLDQLAEELWPTEPSAGEPGKDSDEEEASDVEVDIEKQLAKEMSSMKRPRRERRFGMSLSPWVYSVLNCPSMQATARQTHHVVREPSFLSLHTLRTETRAITVVVVSCRPPVDPVKLVVTHMENIVSSGITQTRWVEVVNA